MIDKQGSTEPQGLWLESKDPPNWSGEQGCSSLHLIMIIMTASQVHSIVMRRFHDQVAVSHSSKPTISLKMASTFTSQAKQIRLDQNIGLFVEFLHNKPYLEVKGNFLSPRLFKQHNLEAQSRKIMAFARLQHMVGAGSAAPAPGEGITPFPDTEVTLQYFTGNRPQHCQRRTLLTSNKGVFIPAKMRQQPWFQQNSLQRDSLCRARALVFLAMGDEVCEVVPK